MFAYGTYKDYRNHVPPLAPLDAAATRKLKHLTVASLAARHKELRYDVLRAELEIENLRELEDLVLDAIYQGLVEGKIDQQSQKVIVDFAIGRDVRDRDLLRIQEVLASWAARSSVLVRHIEEKVALARSEIKAEQMHRDEFDRRVKEIKENLRAIMEAQQDAEGRGGPGKRGGPGGGGLGGGGMGGGMGGQRRDPRQQPGGQMHGFFK